MTEQQAKTLEERAREQAQAILAIEREKELELFRRGMLSASRSLQIAAELCAAGDRARQSERERAE
jgi:hypothetical protein